ncbi:MAG: tripartite tricarboxylate transporter substrate binding protein [Deltaproteobacteria bacterium]|nr:tripartite tricarboxylate transporter substrate binding protein [Deltaproteobacteria bacterium]
MKRRGGFVLFTVAFLILTAAQTRADTFPSRPINLWVAWGAGSGTDISQRAIADIASKSLKQPIVISNVTGGGGTLVLGRLKAEKPDGYALANTSSAALSRIPHLQPVPYNAQEPLKEFIPIISYSYYLYGLAVKSDAPWKTFEEFIAYAKANPGKVRYSTSGVGTGQHLAMEYLAMKENIKWTHVPFATSPQAVAAVMGGHVEATSQTPEWKEQVDSGKMRLLICWNDKRMPFYPNVPTIKEKGYDFSVQAAIIIYAPANTPKEIIATLSKAFHQASETEEVKQILKRLSYPHDIKDSEELIKMIKKDYEVNKKILKELGIGIYKK